MIKEFVSLRRKHSMIFLLFSMALSVTKSNKQDNLR